MRRENPVRRNPLLDPLLEGGHCIEAIRPGATGAVLHPGHHEEAVKLLRLLQAVAMAAVTIVIAVTTIMGAHLGHDALVVVDAVDGRDVWIAEAVVVDELAAEPLEGPEVGVDRVNDGCHWFTVDEFVVRERHICGEVQRVKIPVRVVEDEVLERGDPEGQV